MKLEDVFKSTPRSVYDVLSDTGVCYHIPEYQRLYTWETDKVIKLIDDIRVGCSLLVEKDDAFTFLGTLLTVSDFEGSSLEPELKSEKPTRTSLVIDGQQRLTTLSLISSRLYIEFFKRQIIINNIVDKIEPDDEKFDIINDYADTINRIRTELSYFSKNTNSRSDKYNKYYPIITRARNDIWSKRKNNAFYKSPIANYFYQLNNAILDENITKDIIINDEILASNIEVIDSRLDDIINGYIFSKEIIDIKLLDLNNYYIEADLNIESMMKYIDDEPVFREIANLSIFSSYFLSRTCLTYASANNLDYAFDMFEALNTSGELLTAYETFRPKAIQYFYDLKSKSNYDDENKGRKYLSIIDNYLNVISDSKEKNDATKKLIDTFSYALDGKVCESHISKQRRFLIDHFSKSKDKLSFLSQLANTAEFLFSVWYEKKDSNILSSCVDSFDQKQEFKLSLNLLRSTGHEIARPLLAVSYHEFKKTNNKESLKQIVKMLTAYWVLRRAGTGGTAGIDSRYKELYSGSLDYDIKITFGYDILSNLDRVSNYLTSDLAKTFIGKDSEFNSTIVKENWINKAVKVQQYKTGKQLGICRMLLLASMQDIDITFDSGCYWEAVKCKENSHTTLTYYNWMQFIEKCKHQLTIEHIAPQNPKQYDWDSSLDDGELTNTLGNLVILSRNDNSEASNRSWREKQSLYRELASKEETGVDRNYNEFIKNVSSALAWRADIINSRSRVLLNNSWDNLIPWLLV